MNTLRRPSFQQFAIPVIAGLFASAFAPIASAGQGTLTYTIQGGTAQTGSNWGALNPPTSVTFSDTFTSNTTGVNQSILDDWSFSVPTGVITGTTVTGEQIDFSNFTMTGVLDTVSFYSGTVGSGTLLKTWAPTNMGTYSGVDSYTLTSAGNYYIEITATQASGTVGGYSGVFVASIVPEPTTFGLMAAGLSALAFGAKLRRRRH